MEHEVSSISLTAASPNRAPVSSSAEAGALQPQSLPDSDFLVGPENRLAGAAIQWLLQPGQQTYSPLVFHGPSGTGKSQLVKAIARNRTDAICTNAADFVREMADAINKGAMPKWRNKYRSATMLIFEDLNHLADRDAAQQELLQTLDELAAREVPVVVTSRIPPAELSRLPAALRSRLAGGLEIPLAPPGLAARTAVLERFAATRGIRLSPGALHLLAASLPTTVSQLRGLLIALEMSVKTAASIGKHSAAAHNQITISTQQARKFLAAHQARLRPSLQQVTAAVAKSFGLKPSQLCGPSRRQQVALARSVAIYLGRQLTAQSLQALGKHFGNRDHTTILHSFRQLESRLPNDRQLHTLVTDLRKTLVPDSSTE